MSEWKLICLPKGEALEENHKKGKGSLEMSLHSHKDITAFRDWRLKLVKFSLMKKCILDGFLNLTADSPPSLAGFLYITYFSNRNAAVQPGVNIKMYYVL